MLVLSGRLEDRFYIGDLGYFEILEFRGKGKVRLGFHFPTEIVVDRGVIRDLKEQVQADLADLVEVTRRAF